MHNLDFLDVQKINYLMQLGHNLDSRDWPQRRDYQREYLSNLGWSFDSAWDFSYAENKSELEMAVLLRSAELSRGQYSSEANRVVSGINREYERRSYEKQKEEDRKAHEKWLDDYVDQIFAEARNNSSRIWKSGEGFKPQKRR